MLVGTLSVRCGAAELGTADELLRFPDRRPRPTMWSHDCRPSGTG